MTQLSIDDKGCLVFSVRGDQLVIEVMCGESCIDDLRDFTRAAGELVRAQTERVVEAMLDGQRGLDASGDVGAGAAQQGDGPSSPGVRGVDIEQVNVDVGGDGDPD